MKQGKKSVIEVQGAAITVLNQREQDLICLTDIARYKNPERFDDLVRNWLRNRNTVEFLCVWERLNNMSEIDMVIEKHGGWLGAFAVEKTEGSIHEH